MTLSKARLKRSCLSKHSNKRTRATSRHEAQARTPSNFEDDRSVELVAARAEEAHRRTVERERDEERERDRVR